MNPVSGFSTLQRLLFNSNVAVMDCIVAYIDLNKTLWSLFVPWSHGCRSVLSNTPIDVTARSAHKALDSGPNSFFTRDLC